MNIPECGSPDLGLYGCYAIECNPDRSVWLAYKHLTTLEAREEAQTLAMITSSAMGKMVPIAQKPHENHWLETSWGREYWEMKTRNSGTLYGGRFR